MKGNYKLFTTLAVVFLMILFLADSFAETLKDDSREGKATNLLLSQQLQQGPEASKTSTPKIEFAFSVLSGFDNNCFLDSSSKGDYFQNYLLNIKSQPKLTDNLKLKIDYDYNALSYNELTDNSSVDNALSLGLESTLIPRCRLGVATKVNFLYFPQDETATNWANKNSIYIKHFLKQDFYHLFSYSLIDKNFTNRKAREGEGALSTDKKRRDLRHLADYEVGFYFDKKTLLKLKGQCYLNDSNDKYLDYYDYTCFKTGATLIKLLTDKLSSIVNINFQRKNYGSRLVSDNFFSTKENTYGANLGFSYKLTQNHQKNNC